MNGTTLFETKSPNQTSSISTHSHTDNSNTSNSIQIQPKLNLFQSTKPTEKNQQTLPKKKNKLFETIIEDTFIDKQHYHPTQKKPSSMKHEEKNKENYLDLLIISMEKMMSSSKNITIEYLNSQTYPKCNEMIYKTNIEDEQMSYSRKCENRICAVVVDTIDNFHNANIISFRSNNYKLCEKCYCAWKQGNYCFYCNVIYRDFSFNQQYYEEKKWIQCDYCQKWQHIQCEEKHGTISDIEEMNKNEAYKYMCPFCRDERGLECKNGRKEEEDDDEEEEEENEDRNKNKKLLGQKKKRGKRAKGKKLTLGGHKKKAI